jgi:hypothetical protein
MQFKAQEDLAMILPLPVPAGTPEDGVKFVNLKEFPEFFARLDLGFPPPKPTSRSLAAGPKSAPTDSLAVVEVGEFEASFVPTLADFNRLDERFRLPPGTWDQLPLYKTYGFAVFKLKPGAKRVHPMAFEFPRSKPKWLFFPTVHIHDGKLHAKAEFHHTLYCQAGEQESMRLADWEESAQPAGMFLDVKKSQGLIDANGHVYRRRMRGMLKNEDVLV